MKRTQDSISGTVIDKIELEMQLHLGLMTSRKVTRRTTVKRQAQGLSLGIIHSHTTWTEKGNSITTMKHQVVICIFITELYIEKRSSIVPADMLMTNLESNHKRKKK